MMLQDRRKDSWPNQVKNILDRAGLGNCWNEGKGIGERVGTVSRSVASRLESQVWEKDKINKTKINKDAGTVLKNGSF